VVCTASSITQYYGKNGPNRSVAVWLIVAIYTSCDVPVDRRV